MANVGYATLQIIPSARGFGAALQKETGTPIAAGGKRSGKAFGGAFIGSLKGIAGPMAAVFGVSAAAGFAKSAVEEASNLNESVNAVRVSYGGAAKDVLALGKNSATTFGIARSEFNGFAVRFSGFANTIAGKGGDVTGTFEKIVGRATDFASVMNLDVAEAARLFQSGLAGELEALRQYGIDLSMAKVESFAYAKGIAKSGQELSQAQIVQARYGLLMKLTSKTQGDFANTSDQLANQQRILSARWTDAKAALAKGLLPVATRFVTFLNGALGPSLKFVTGLFDGFGKGGKGGGLGKTFQTIQTFAAPLMATLRKIGQDVMAVVKPAFAQISAIFTGTLLPAFRAFLPAVQPVANFLLNVLGGAVVGVIKGVVNVVKGVMTAISGVFNVFAGLLTGDWKRLWNGIKQIVSGVLRAVWGAVQVIWNGSILNLFRKGAAFLLKGIWKKLWSGIKSLAAKGMSAAKGLISKAWSAIRGVFSKALSAVVNFVKGGFAKAKNIIRTAMAFARGFLSGAWSAIRSLISNAVSAIWSRVKSGFARIVDSVRSGITNAVDFVRGLPGKALSALSGIGSKLVSAGQDLMRGFISGVKDMAGSLIASVTEPVRGAISKAKNILGINSPSRVFMEIGGFTAEGMALGMKKGSGKVAKAAAAMVAIPDANGRVGVSGGGMAGGRALVENLTLQGSGNVHDDLEEVFFQVRRLERGGAHA